MFDIKNNVFVSAGLYTEQRYEHDSLNMLVWRSWAGVVNVVCGCEVGWMYC